MRRDLRHIVLPVGATLVGMLAASIGATSALATNADACGTISQHTMAKAFDLTNVIEHKTLLSDTGDPAGVIHERCLAYAYKDPKPTNSAQRRAALLAGTGAEIRIETWVADSGPSAEVWLSSFSKRLATLKSQARTQFLRGPLHGSTYNPPRFDAEAAIGYQGRAGAIQKIRGLWWDANSGTLLSASVVEARGKPLRASLRALMSGVVPSVL